VRALDRKLLRDLAGVKGQAIAIALVIGSGVAMFVMYLSNFDSLRLTRQAYYERYRFADVFAGCKRAPDRLAGRIAEIPGVNRVATRVVTEVSLDVEGLDEPAVGRLVSIPAGREPELNALFLRSGRWIEPGRPDEVLVGEGFALAHGLGPGDRVAAVIYGRRRQLEIVGVALSPEYVYSIRPGQVVPDDRLYGIFWMEHRALAAALDMEGGFNDVALDLAPGASAPEVIDRLDRLLELYGGLGAIPRAQQISHWYLESELTSLRTVGWIVPAIFLAVASFLLNVVLVRIVSVQREQIAALKALGYGNREIGLHYAEWGLAIAVAGVALGSLGGARLGVGMLGLYNEFYRFPELVYRLDPAVVAGAVTVSLAAAVLGALGAVRRAVRLPPAEAMRPEPPAMYRRSLVERLGAGRWLGQAARMVIRNLERRPWRALASVVGIAFAAAMLITGMFMVDAIDVVLETVFQAGQRQDVTVTFIEPRPASAFYAVTRMPGVLDAEPERTVAVRLVHGHRARYTAIVGLPARSRLLRVVDHDGRAVELPPAGLVTSAKLAELLAAEPGDVLTVEVREGERPVRRLPLAATVDDYLGTAAYMEIGALRRLLREGQTVSAVELTADPVELDRLYHALKSTPAVAAVNLRDAAIASFKSTLAETLGLLIFFNVLFAGIIAFGVVYNAARVSLSERSRELASLRVLGFTRAEIGAILLGELAVLTLVAVPLGLVMGYGLAALVAMAYDTELYRFPLVVFPRTFAAAAGVVLVAAAVSALAVRRRLNRLDLVAVLKTRE
jgi:putative ABC transport system permease protein